jgi:hypothetical protein
LNVITGVDPVYLNAGLMKPRRGFTLVAGKEKLGVGKVQDVHPHPPLPPHKGEGEEIRND